MTGPLHVAVASRVTAGIPRRGGTPPIAVGPVRAVLGRAGAHGRARPAGLHHLRRRPDAPAPPQARDRCPLARRAARRGARRRSGGPATSHIGLVPVATVTHTEPFHVSKAFATLDFVSHGRAGWQPRVSSTAHEAALFGRRDIAGADLFAEAVDAVTSCAGRDSWDDDAVIRDVDTAATSTGRLTTSTSSVRTSRSRGRRSRRARRRGSPSSQRSRMPGRSTNSPPAVQIWCSSPPPMTTRCAPSLPSSPTSAEPM